MVVLAVHIIRVDNNLADGVINGCRCAEPGISAVRIGACVKVPNSHWRSENNVVGHQCKAFRIDSVTPRSDGDLPVCRRLYLNSHQPWKWAWWGFPYHFHFHVDHNKRSRKFSMWLVRHRYNYLHVTQRSRRLVMKHYLFSRTRRKKRYLQSMAVGFGQGAVGWR